MGNWFAEVWSSLGAIETLYKSLSLLAATFGIITALAVFAILPVSLQRERLKDLASQVFGSVAGIVELEDKESPNNIQITFNRDDGELKTTLVDNVGRFTMRLLEGNYRIEMFRNGYDRQIVENVSVNKGALRLPKRILKVTRRPARVQLLDHDGVPFANVNVQFTFQSQNIFPMAIAEDKNDLMTDGKGWVQTPNIGFQTLQINFGKTNVSDLRQAFLLCKYSSDLKCNSVLRLGTKDEYKFTLPRILYSSAIKSGEERVQGQFQNFSKTRYLAQPFELNEIISPSVFGISLNDTGDSKAEIRRDEQGKPGTLIVQLKKVQSVVDTSWGAYKSRPVGLGRNYQAFWSNGKKINLAAGKYWFVVYSANDQMYLETLGHASPPDFGSVVVSNDGTVWAPASFINGIHSFDVFLSQ